MEESVLDRLAAYLEAEGIPYTRMSAERSRGVGTVYFHFIDSLTTYAAYISYEKYDNDGFKGAIEIEDFTNKEEHISEFQSFEQLESIIKRYIEENQLRSLFKRKKLFFTQELIKQIQKELAGISQVEMEEEEILLKIKKKLKTDDLVMIEVRIGDHPERMHQIVGKDFELRC